MKRPNILLIYTDQQRWDALGAAGNPAIHTPNLDRLAAESLRFDRCFVQNPVCMPSRASMLTGQYPSRLGIFQNGAPVPEAAAPLPSLLGAAGYHCANIGKLHFLPHANRDHRETHPSYGFHLLRVSDEPGSYDDAYRAWVALRAPDQLEHISLGLPKHAADWRAIMGEVETGVNHPARGAHRTSPFPGREDVTHSAFVADATKEYLDARKADPFFCIAGFFAPHDPWTVPQRFLDLYDPQQLPLPDYPKGWQPKRGEIPSETELRAAVHGYFAMVSEVDHYTGILLETLEDGGLADDTIVIFTSDHGEWLGEHARFGKGYHAPDCISRVPCLMRFPDSWNIRPGVCRDIIEAVDLAPTILETCGVQPPPHLQGTSLLPLLRGGARPDSAALMEGHGWKSLRTDTHHYLVRRDGSEMLFDPESDPGEYHDLSAAPEHAETLHAMRRALLEKILRIERGRPRLWRY